MLATLPRLVLITLLLLAGLLLSTALLAATLLRIALVLLLVALLAALPWVVRHGISPVFEDLTLPLGPTPQCAVSDIRSGFRCLNFRQYFEI